MVETSRWVPRAGCCEEGVDEWWCGCVAREETELEVEEDADVNGT
jgi:hypothetical protein